jgi:hypothetical protein
MRSPQPKPGAVPPPRVRGRAPRPVARPGGDRCRAHGLAAAKAAAQIQLQAASAAWHARANDIATFLRSANPDHWPLVTRQDPMKMRLDQTTAEAVANLKKAYPADIAAYDAVHDHILKMADALSAGIVAHFRPSSEERRARRGWRVPALRPIGRSGRRARGRASCWRAAGGYAAGASLPASGARCKQPGSATAPLGRRVAAIARRVLAQSDRVRRSDGGAEHCRSSAPPSCN